MSEFWFGILLIVVFFIVFIVLAVAVDCTKLDCLSNLFIALAFIQILATPIIWDLIFWKNAEQVEVIETYELVPVGSTEYVQLSGGKYSNLYVMYIDKDDKLQYTNVSGKTTIVVPDGEERIEEVKVKWGFIHNTTKYIYIPKGF